MRLLRGFLVSLITTSACASGSATCEQASVAVTATTPAAFTLATCAGTNSLRVTDLTTGNLVWLAAATDAKPLPLRLTYGQVLSNTYPSTATPLVAGREYLVEAETIVGGDGIAARTTAQFVAGTVGQL